MGPSSCHDHCFFDVAFFQVAFGFPIVRPSPLVKCHEPTHQPLSPKQLGVRLIQPLSPQELRYIAMLGTGGMVQSEKTDPSTVESQVYALAEDT